MLATVASDPSRLRGVAVFDPDIPEAQLARLDAGGVQAIRLNLRGVSVVPEQKASRLVAKHDALGESKVKHIFCCSKWARTDFLFE